MVFVHSIVWDVDVPEALALPETMYYSNEKKMEGDELIAAIRNFLEDWYGFDVVYCAFSDPTGRLASYD